MRFQKKNIILYIYIFAIAFIATFIMFISTVIRKNTSHPNDSGLDPATIIPEITDDYFADKPLGPMPKEFQRFIENASSYTCQPDQSDQSRETPETPGTVNEKITCPG